MQLTTTTKVKNYLGITVSTYDTLISSIIDGVSDQAESYCNRNFNSATYTEYYDTELGDTKVFVKNYPVTSVTSLSYRSGTFGNPTWEAFNTNDYLLSDNGKISLALRLPESEKYIKVVYVGGYKIDFANETNTALHTLPAGLTQIITEMVAETFNMRKVAGILSESTEGQSITFATGTSNNDTYMKNSLAMYRSFNM